MSASALGPSPIPASSEVHELRHTIEVSIDEDGATLLVERTFHNPGASPATVELPVELPCELTLDALRLADVDGTSWTPAPILAHDDADHRWSSWRSRPADTSAAAMRDPDVALLMTRSEWGCDAELSLFPLAPFGERSVSYRLFAPSSYRDGAYHIELPSLADHGLAATLELDPARVGSGFALEIDGAALSGPLPLDASRAHQLALTPNDDARASVEAASLDLPALLAANPDARAMLTPEELDQPAGHLVHARLDAPARLAQLPPVRRVVVLLDASHSLEQPARDAAKQAAGAYLEALAEHARATGQAEPMVEIMDFARDVAPLYHDLVPLRWALDDLGAVERASRNGSALDLALARARELLADAAAHDPSPLPGKDWIVVFSDLELRAAFDLEAEARHADQGEPRVHVVDVSQGSAFAPAATTDPWTALAMSSGGMAWVLGENFYQVEALGAELVEPRRIWNLQLEVEHAGGTREAMELLESELLAGQRYADMVELDAGIEALTFSGEVWGQPRAWSARAELAAARRVAGRVASDRNYSDASEASRTALAHYAQVITPFTSAYLEQLGAGALPVPRRGFGMRGIGCRLGHGTSCGGAHGIILTNNHPPTLEQLAQTVLDACPQDRAGQLVLETTDREIVDVTAASTCTTEHSWTLDLRPIELDGHRSFTITYAAGQVSGIERHEL